MMGSSGYALGKCNEVAVLSRARICSLMILLECILFSYISKFQGQ